jgi:glycosyltransferase involved in cell wall biosynthesis
VTPARRPTVSIGIPVYNGGPYVDACLEAVAAQTFTDFEVIVSDNASTDGTADIVQSFVDRDPRFTLVRFETNRGSAANWDRVVELATGRYFKWLAADDVIAPTYLERCVEVLDGQSDVVLVTPRVRLIDDRGEPLPRVGGTDRYVAPHGESKPAPSAPVSGLASRSRLRRFRSVVMYLTDSGLAAYDMSLIRLDALRATFLVERYVGSEKVLLAQLALVGRFVLVPEKLYSWRIHADHMGAKSPADATRQMDPTWTGRYPLMGPRQIAGYLRAIRSADVDAITKLGCLAVILEKIPRGAWTQLKQRRAVR